MKLLMALLLVSTVVGADSSMKIGEKAFDAMGGIRSSIKSLSDARLGCQFDSDCTLHSLPNGCGYVAKKDNFVTSLDNRFFSIITQLVQNHSEVQRLGGIAGICPQGSDAYPVCESNTCRVQFLSPFPGK